jgi:hypothetical protein
MLFQSLSLRSDQGNILLILSKGYSQLPVASTDISHSRNTSYLTSAIHIAFDVVLGVLVAF